MAMIPMALYGLEVPSGDVAIPARPDIPAAFRITMAAIDPSAEPEGDESSVPRATLKVIRQPLGMEDSDDDEDEFDIDDMDEQFGEDDSDVDEDDEDSTGGPSDPAKSKKAKREQIRQKVMKMVEEEGMDVDEDDIPNGVNGTAKSSKAKGKMPASDDDEDEDEKESDDEGAEIEEFVICTLDPNKMYQQPLDVTFGEDERVWFKVSGTHSIFLTGNYVEPIANPQSMYDPDSDEEEDYDLPPDLDELDDSLDNESMDELDDMEDPRITEIGEEDIDVPALISTKTKKIEDKKPATNKNKRPAPDSEDEADAGAEGLDEMIAKEAKDAQPTTNGEPKLSKKQLKKLKKNDGAAAPVTVTEKVEAKEEPPSSSNKSDKKVAFAKELEQGPTPTKDKVNGKAADGDKSKASLGAKTIQGVTVDDKKLGSGQAAKNGDRVGLRYIGKLKSDNKVFDSNKSGKPFSFKLGAGEVIKGWEIGVQGMQAGGERRITIPAHLAYGSKKMGVIPANSALVFDVKVLDINKGK